MTKKFKLDEAKLSINGEEIKPCSIKVYSIIIDRIDDDIYIRVKNWEGGEVSGKDRQDIINDLIPKVYNSLNIEG